MNVTKKQLIVLALMASAPVMAKAQKRPAAKDIAWLQGTWEMKSGNSVTYEEWSRVDDTTYIGRSYAVKGSDTMIFETIRIVQRNGVLQYIPTVRNQNGGEPVPFNCTGKKGNKLIFENPQHDFPKKITYAPSSANALTAEISGLRNGKEKKIQFPMTRVK